MGEEGALFCRSFRRNNRLPGKQIIIASAADHAVVDAKVDDKEARRREHDGNKKALMSAPATPSQGQGLFTKADAFERRWNLNLRDTAKLEDFVVHRTVGLGAFGRVLYVTAKMRNHGYAMKAMKKEKLVRMEQVERVLAEKRILQSVVHPFMVNLRFVFKSNSYLFMVMPFVAGGEIYSYMRAYKTFSEAQCRFVSGQLILALQYLHAMGIVYRDLKPENVLLDCDGYVKITDFGFAKRIGGAAGAQPSTTSFVGTPEYMAPEMLVRVRRAKGYSFTVDWWALGVLVYECAAGEPPFSGASLLQVFDHIVKGRYEIPEQFSDPLADLLMQLFETDESRRIGCGQLGSDEIKAHQWYASMNWQALLEKKLPSEFMPKCGANDPTANFDRFEEEPLEEAVKDEYSSLFRHF